jgi:hypothetical protein
MRMMTRVFFFLSILFLPLSPVLAQDEIVPLTVREVDAEILSIESVEEVDGDFAHYTLKVRSEYGVEYLVDTLDSHQPSPVTLSYPPPTI